MCYISKSKAVLEGISLYIIVFRHYQIYVIEKGEQVENNALDDVWESTPNSQMPLVHAAMGYCGPHVNLTANGILHRR